MNLDKFIGEQVKHPRGMFSGVIAQRMNQSNVDINKNTIQLLEIEPTDRVLEIGFGGGDGLNEMTKLIQSGLLAGIEISDDMIKLSRKRFKDFISQGKLELKKGSSKEIPYEDGFFDRVCVINCIYFWSDPLADLREIMRVMKNEGKLVLSAYTEEMKQKFSFSRRGYIFYSESQVQYFLDEAGFKDISFEHRKCQEVEAVFSIGTKR